MIVTKDLGFSHPSVVLWFSMIGISMAELQYWESYPYIKRK